MLEVVNAAGVIRQGEAKLEFSSAYQGYITFIKGVDSDGTPVLACPMSSAQSAQANYPIKKLKFEEDLSDTSDAVDKLTWGDRVVYYEGGEFITDKCARDGISFGRALLTATALVRGGYGVDIVATTVAPLVPLYVEWGNATAGRLTAVAVGTAGPYSDAGWGSTAVAGVKYPKQRFRLMQAWGSTASIGSYLNSDSTQATVRFKVIPGMVGMTF